VRDGGGALDRACIDLGVGLIKLPAACFRALLRRAFVPWCCDCRTIERGLRVLDMSSAADSAQRRPDPCGMAKTSLRTCCAWIDAADKRIGSLWRMNGL